MLCVVRRALVRVWLGHASQALEKPRTRDLAETPNGRTAERQTDAKADAWVRNRVVQFGSDSNERTQNSAHRVPHVGNPRGGVAAGIIRVGVVSGPGHHETRRGMPS
jgi:hypothetical protein